MWQKKFEQYGNEEFTVVGLALDAEGIPPAKRYYDEFGVTFPALVDPNYATKFGAVPKTFLIDEHGVVMSPRDWENTIATLGPVKPVTDEIREQFQSPAARLEASSVAALVAANAKNPRDQNAAVQLASRYLALGLNAEAERLLQQSIEGIDPRAVAQAGGEPAVLLSQVFLQLSRSAADQQQRVQHATMSFYLNPTIGFGKQIARIIAPEKFDGRADGSFDNAFREGTLRRLVKERRAWLQESN